MPILCDMVSYFLVRLSLENHTYINSLRVNGDIFLVHKNSRELIQNIISENIKHYNPPSCQTPSTQNNK